VFGPAPMPMPGFDGGMVAGPMPAPVPRIVVPKAKKADPAKGDQLTTIGDRLFRARNFKRAAERYEQAMNADPASASPRVRLAQVAMVRGQYAEAARHLREAIAAEPGWLARAKDIQTIFGEPADFHRELSRLESHLLHEPGDRDAWLLLGAELYLSGETRRAGDVFLRLTDRKPDAALAAFLEAADAKK